MNSTKKVKVFASIVVLVAAVFAQTVHAVLAQEQVLIAVYGTLMRGLELEPNLVNLGATFVREDRTEPAYSLYSVNDIHPAMVTSSGQCNQRCVPVAVEIWSVPADGVATLLSKEPGLSIGKIKLQNGTTMLGVLAEPALEVGRKDISNFDGSWREYIAQTGIQLIDKAIQSSNMTSQQSDALKQHTY